jgi:DsbC/DsbD-like thiol-disulfide interchange protein
MTIFNSHKWPAIFALLCGVMPQQAAAAASQWEETEGARLRMVAEPARPGETALRGVLQIELEPGWKTYWREPGAAGIPPQVSVRNDGISGVTIHYPAPEWHDDPYGSWAGYEHPVSLPLTFALSGDAAPAALEADVFLGICRDVCVPVSVHFEVPVGEGKANAMRTLLLDAAFAALPAGNSERLAIEDAQWRPDGALEITVHLAAASGEPQLFLSAGVNHPFKKPVRVSNDGETAVFHAEPVFDPAKAGEIDLMVTARRGIDAVEIPLTLPAP